MELLRGQLKDARRMIDESQRHEKALRRALRRAERDVSDVLSPERGAGRHPRMLAQLSQPPPPQQPQQQPPWLPAVLPPPPSMPLPLPPTLPPEMRVPQPPPARHAAYGGGGGGFGGLASSTGDAAALAAAQEQLAADAALNRSLDALAEQLCAEAVGAQLGGVVKDAVREVVAGILPPPRPRRSPHEKPVYVELLGAVMTEALAEEGAEIVSEALATLAHDYVGRRGAERELALMLDDVLLSDAIVEAQRGARPPVKQMQERVPDADLKACKAALIEAGGDEDKAAAKLSKSSTGAQRDSTTMPGAADRAVSHERAWLLHHRAGGAATRYPVAGMLGDVAFEARVEVAMEQLVDEVVDELAASSTAAAVREARGGAARARETKERALVAEVASQAMLEELMLERLLQQLAARGEGALLQRAGGMMLDEMLANGLCRHALRLARRQSSVRDSLILGSAHRQLANRAMLEEMLAQLQGLSASGLEGAAAGEAPPDETDTEGELDDEAPT